MNICIFPLIYGLYEGALKTFVPPLESDPGCAAAQHSRYTLHFLEIMSVAKAIFNKFCFVRPNYLINFVTFCVDYKQF